MIADGLLKQAGQNGLGIFSIAPIGLMLSLTGTIFFLLFGRFLLPSHRGEEDSIDHFRMEGDYTELVLLPDSPLIGKTIREVEEQQSTDFKVSAWYRNNRPCNWPFGRKKIQEGDVLVLIGDSDALKRLSENQSLWMLVPFRGEPKPLHKARLARTIMVLSTAIAALNIIPVEIVLLMGAAVMILSGCISMQRAYQSIDTRIYVFIAGAIPLGLAMQKTGTADLLAGCKVWCPVGISIGSYWRSFSPRGS